MSGGMAAAQIGRRIEEIVPGITYSALVVDDDADVRKYLTRVLSKEFGLEVSEAEGLEWASEMLSGKSYCMVFIDKCLPDGDGVEFSRRLLLKFKDLPVVIITGEGSGEEAAGALDSGVFDYLPKPCSLDEVREVVNKILHRYLMRNEEPPPVESRPKQDSEPVLVGKSRQMIEVSKQARRIAQMDRPVLIQGATGTGKEVLARRIHFWSPNRLKRFVPVNCGAIPAELIESELFGHVKGAFTGADRERRGLFEQADGGTIFLDEITETSLSFQVKLLRVLQEGTIRKVGSSEEVKLKLRVIAASNRNVKEEVAKGRFREDLYFRLKGSEIYLPALKERPRDILELAEYFAARGPRPVVFSEEVEDVLEAYSWPGNVRELENAIDVAAKNCDGEVLLSDLPLDIRMAVKSVVRSDEKRIVGVSRRFPTLKEVEARHIRRVLRANGGNKSQAAKELGINRHTINIKLSEVGEVSEGDDEKI